MKIIEPPKPFVVSCRYCRAKLEVEMKDITLYEFQPWGRRFKEGWFRCPACNKTNIIII